MNRYRDESGNALTTSVLMILALGAILSGLFTMISAEYLRSRQHRDETRSFYVAEAGLNEAYAELVAEGFDGPDGLAYPKDLGGGTYTVDFTRGTDDPVLLDNRVRFRSTGRQGRATSAIEVVAWAVPNGKYVYGAFGDEGVVVNSQAAIDSFDSNEGPYGGVLGDGALGNLGSNQDIELDANVQIYGDVTPGPAGVVIDSAPNSTVTGSTSSADEPVELDPVTVPASTPSGALAVVGNQTIGPGDSHYAKVSVLAGGELTIVGPATVVVDDFSLLSNGDLVIDSAAGPVEIYGTGDFELHSNSSVTTTSEQAKDVSVFLTGDTDATPGATVELASNAEFTGTIYAPDADLVLASNFEIFGSVMAEHVELASNAQLHFDEDLLYEDGVIPDFEQLSWRVVSPQEL